MIETMQRLRQFLDECSRKDGMQVNGNQLARHAKELLASMDSIPHPGKGDKAIAIRVGNRYFLKFGKEGRIQTAWSLAGATLFQESDMLTVHAIETRIAEKRHREGVRQVPVFAVPEIPF
jgi:hypothetical protein